MYSCKRCEEERLSTLNDGALLPHTYDKEVVDEKYLKSPATETESAVYYKSCVCGEKGESTFSHGSPLSAEKPSSGGCGGSIGEMGVVFLGLGVAVCFKVRKKKEN